MEEAEQARDRVHALRLPVDILAYTFEQVGGAGAQDPATA